MGKGCNLVRVRGCSPFMAIMNFNFIIALDDNSAVLYLRFTHGTLPLKDSEAVLPFLLLTPNSIFIEDTG